MAKAPRTKLTQAKHDAIVEAVRLGNTRNASAGAGGIDRRLLYSWLGKGEPDENGDYPDDVFGRLRQAVDIADDEAERRAQKVVQDAIAGGNWQAAMTWLERRRNAEWSKFSKMEVSGDAPIEITATSKKVQDAARRFLADAGSN